MKRLAIILLLFLVGWSGPLRAKDPDPKKPSRQLQVLFSYVEGVDEELRDHAIKRLLTLGAKAVPFIKERLNTRAKHHYRYILRRIEQSNRLRIKHEAEADKHRAQLNQQQMLRRNWTKFLAEYLGQKLDRVKQLGSQGHYTAAIALVEALLKVEPEMSAPLKARLTALRSTYKAKRFAATAIQGEVEVPKRIYVWKEPIKLTFVLTNNSAQQYLIRHKIMVKDPNELQKEAEHHSVIRVKYKVFDYHMDGRKLGKEQDIDLTLTRDVTLGKDQKWRRAWTMPETPWPGAGYLYREIEVDARAIPVGMKAAATLHDQTKILFPLQRLKVFPQEYQSLADKPLLYLGNLIRTQRPRDAFIAGLLVAPHQRKAAIELLVGSLGKYDAATTSTTYALLMRLSGKRLGPDGDRWKLWWMANRERFTPKND